MKFFSHLQLALLLLFVTDITIFDNKPFKSKILTEGFFIKQKSTLQEGPLEKDVCKKKSSSPLKLAACAMRQKPCRGERPSSDTKELTECPFCGRSMCPQQQQQPPQQQQNQQKKPSCPNQKNSCPQQKTSCPQARPKCPAAPKSKCHPPTRPSCPPPEKTTCPYEKPSPCPERCSLFRKFSFPASMNIKYPSGAAVKIEHKSDKCPPKCPGGVNCKGKPIK